MKTKKVSDYLLYMPLQLRLTPKMMKDRSTRTNLFTSRRKSRIVDNHHLLQVYRCRHIIITGMDFWVVLCPSIGKFKKSFLRHYEHIFYITCIIHAWLEIMVKKNVRRNVKRILLQHITNGVYTTVKDCHECAQKSKFLSADASHNVFPVSGPLKFVRWTAWDHFQGRWMEISMYW